MGVSGIGPSATRCALVAMLAAGTLGLSPATATAQQQRQGAQQGQAGQQALPPALVAAIQTGNPMAIQQVIRTLSGGNPQMTADLAARTARAAESLAATNPVAALRAVMAALSVMDSTSVQMTSPQSLPAILVSAARIFAMPGVQAADPRGVGAAAQSVVGLVTQPDVYRQSPEAALQAMAAAYAAVNAPAVRAAAPEVTSAVRAQLASAGQQQALSSVNPANPVRIAQILGGGTVQETEQRRENQQPAQNQPGNLIRDGRGENPFVSGSPT